MQQGGSGAGASNFISASAYLGTPVRSGPVDSFMVYVGVPTDPTACQYSDGAAPRPIFDLKRRWFSEVIAIDKPYKEILSTFGTDSAYAVYAVHVHREQRDHPADAHGPGRGGRRRRHPHRLPQQDQRELRRRDQHGWFVRFDQQGRRPHRRRGDHGLHAGVHHEWLRERRARSTTRSSLPTRPRPARPSARATRWAAWHSTGKSPKLMAHVHPLYGGYVGPGQLLLAAGLRRHVRCAGFGDPSVQHRQRDHVDRPTTISVRPRAARSALRSRRTGTASCRRRSTWSRRPTGINECGIDRLHVETTERLVDLLRHLHGHLRHHQAGQRLGQLDDELADGAGERGHRVGRPRPTSPASGATATSSAS